MVKKQSCLKIFCLTYLPLTWLHATHGYADALKECIQHAYQRVRSHSAVEQRKQKANYDCLATVNTFETGNLVLLHYPTLPCGRSPKFHQPWQGPFKVVKRSEVWYTASNTCKTLGNDLLYIPTGSKNTLLRKRMKAVQRITGLFYPAWWSKWEHQKLFLLYRKKHHKNDK